MKNIGLWVCIVTILLAGLTACGVSVPSNIRDTVTTAPASTNPGTKVQVFSLLAKDDSLWAGTSDGLVVWSIERETPTRIAKMGSLTNNLVTAGTQDSKGNLWFVGSKGATEYDGQDWSTFPELDGVPSEKAISIFNDSRGNLWFACGWDGVVFYDGIKWRKYALEDITTSTVIAFVTQVVEDGEGYIWCSTYYASTGIKLYKLERNEWNPISHDDTLTGETVHQILLAKDNNLWFVTGGGGVTRYDGAIWKNYSARDGLASNFVNALIQDHQESLWFATGSGVSRFDGNNWQSFTVRDGLADNNVHALALDSKGRLWFGTDNGISRFDRTQWKSFLVHDSP